MANYKELEGFGVQTLATDPDSAGWVGSIFYNSTSGTFKVVKAGGIAVATWASGGALPTATQGLSEAGVGTQTDALVAGGLFPGLPVQSQTLSYNGTSWSSLNNLNTARQFGSAFGTTTAAIIAAGETTIALTNVESWDGTNWTATTSLPLGVTSAASIGDSQTSGSVIGGYNASNRANNQNWNGTSWTELTDINTARHGLTGVGTTSDAIVFSGDDAPNQNAVESYNGTSWTEVTEPNTPRYRAASSGSSSTNALQIGGNVPPYSALTEFWNGSSWTELNDLSTARVSHGGIGSTSSALAVGGNNGSYLSATEEWTAPDVVINTLTTS
jgi:membrane-associated protease RseP (regulator of RpoE activity)